MAPSHYDYDYHYNKDKYPMRKMMMGHDDHSNKMKKFKPHKMYKGRDVRMAKTYADHIALGKAGYGHHKKMKSYHGHYYDHPEKLKSSNGDCEWSNLQNCKWDDMTKSQKSFIIGGIIAIVINIVLTAMIPGSPWRYIAAVLLWPFYFPYILYAYFSGKKRRRR